MCEEVSVRYRVHEVTRSRAIQTQHGEIVSVLLLPEEGSNPEWVDGSMKLEFRDPAVAAKLFLDGVFLVLFKPFGK